MTDIEMEAEKSKRTRKKTVFALILGGLTGFLVSFGLIKLVDSGALGSIGSSEEAALLVGLLYVVTCGVVLFGLANPNAGAKFLNVEDADELREQKSMLIGSGIGMGAAGIALIVVALGGEGGLIDPMVALAAYAVLAILAVVASVRSYKQQDELMRAVGNETGSTGYYLILLFGGTWTILAHLGFVTALAPLDWLTLFWASMLLAAFIVCARRGLLTMR